MNLNPTRMVFVTIPVALYRNLENRCDSTSPEFAILKNGVIDGDHAVILCAEDAAALLRDWAETCYRGAAAQITIVAEPDSETS